MARDSMKIKSERDLTELDRIEIEHYMEETGCSMEEAIAHHNEMVEEYEEDDTDEDIVAKYGKLSDDELAEIDEICERAKNGETFDD